MTEETIQDIDKQIAELKAKRKKLSETWPKIVILFAHCGKDDNYEKADKLFDNESAKRTFAYTCYEVAIRLEVHKDGTAYATHVDDVALVTKVKMN